MDIREKSFSLDSMTQKPESFTGINFTPMWKMLDDFDRKIAPMGGINNVPLKTVFERIYEYGVISIGLQKADMQGRIDDLNAKNLELFIQTENLQRENIALKMELADLKEGK